MTQEFSFGSDTNTQLFMEYLLSVDIRFQYDTDRLVVSVPTGLVDRDVADRARDLGGVMLGTRS